MKNYIFCISNTQEDLKRIRLDFKKIFRVDLDDPKYESASIKDKWEAIVKDIFPNYLEDEKEELIHEFFITLNEFLNKKLLYGTYTEEIQQKIESCINQKLHGCINKMYRLLDNYSMYDADVWINAYLSFCYIKAKDCVNNVSDEKMSALILDDKYHVTAKGIQYVIPFETCENNFCRNYLNTVMGKDNVQILGSELGDNEKESYKEKENSPIGNEKRVELSFERGKRYTRWERKHVEKLENCKSFHVEDKIFFLKTINAALIRNLTDVMISTGITYDVEEYIYLLDRLCSIESFNWQNFIGCIYIYLNQFLEKIQLSEIWDEIQRLYAQWFYSIEIIDRRLELLTKGLIYCIYRPGIDSDMMKVVQEDIKNKSEEALKKITINPVLSEERERIAKVWQETEKDLRMNNQVKNNHKQIEWIYAIMQRHAITALTPKNNKRFRYESIEWKNFILSVKEMLRKVEREQQINGMLKKSMKVNNETDAMIRKIGGYGEILRICELLYSEGRTTRTDFEKEIVNSLERSKYKENNIKNAERIIRRIYDIIIIKDVKMRLPET